jgi:competence ComEA-like helix-hairpin-helix protein
MHKRQIMGTLQEIGLLLLALLMALAAARPPAAAFSPDRFSCSRPAGMESGGRRFLLCLDRPEALRVLGSAGCSQAEAREGETLKIEAGCRPSGESLPASWLLQLGRRLDINRASAADLEELPGIGPELARRIVEFRSLKGRVEELEELIEVKGIGPRRLEALRRWLRVENRKR